MVAEPKELASAAFLPEAGSAQATIHSVEADSAEVPLGLRAIVADTAWAAVDSVEVAEAVVVEAEAAAAVAGAAGDDESLEQKLSDENYITSYDLE